MTLPATEYRDGPVIGSRREQIERTCTAYNAAKPLIAALEKDEHAPQRAHRLEVLQGVQASRVKALRDLVGDDPELGALVERLTRTAKP